jgi:1,4-alpha-glucan branching enzyme
MKERGRERGLIQGTGLLTDHDIYLFKEGSHFKLHEKLGAHRMTVNGVPGIFFSVWAPNAEGVSVIGDFNQWNPDRHPLAVRGDHSGIWEGFLPGLGRGTIYKYHLRSRNGYRVDKGDPFAFFSEPPPKTASIAWELEGAWHDQEWMKDRQRSNALHAPMAIYEMHLGSWKRVPEEGNRPLTYRELADSLTKYLQEMGFTHVEFLPLMEHPFYGSWGYQTVGYFAPTSRYGTPEDLIYLIDHLHQNGIGVILDWVPSHFPSDEHGLIYFDGTHLYEHADPRKGFHPDWSSYIFNYGRHEVQAFLISSALFWLEQYHIDALRIDAVASMLYLDYSRKEGEWIPNQYGGRENLEAVQFLKRLNEAVYGAFPDVQTMAEESTAWPMVSRPTYLGGLGFGMKWNMGWMHDTLSYFSKDPVYRKYHHGQLTFSILYGFSENFLLPLSHDEVVHGKGSLLDKMPGDPWQRFANLRLLFGYMYGHPGKKLLFMGGEFAQGKGWNHDESLDWHLLDVPAHQQMQRWVRDLNTFYRGEPALHQKDFDPSGFEWIDCNDYLQNILSFLRRGEDPQSFLAIVCNFTPMTHQNYRLGVPAGGFWQEVLNSDATLYGGSGQGNMGGVEAAPQPFHGRPYSVHMTLPPLSMVVFKNKRE